MRLFVTGATGFIGSAIVRKLQGAGHDVLGNESIPSKGDHTMTLETEFKDEAARWTDLASDYEAIAEPFTRQYAHAALAMVGGIGLGPVEN